MKNMRGAVTLLAVALLGAGVALAGEALLPARVGSAASVVQPEVRSLGVADSAADPIEVVGPGPLQAILVRDTELSFTLTSPATVLVIGSITFATGSGTGYFYPNLTVDGRDGGSHGAGHHFAATDSDGGSPGAWVSATWTRVELLKAGQHTAALTVDVDRQTSGLVFTGSVRAIALGSASGS